MNINHTVIAETFAEAFTMTATRIVITATNQRWCEIAARETTGYGTSVISCDAEAGIESFLSAEETPDGRPGVAIQLYAFSKDALQQAVVSRLGQCVLTCATTSCFNGLTDSEPEKRIDLGRQLRFFGDGFQIAKELAGRRYWRIPVMEGEFVCEDRIGTQKSIAGGNLILAGHSITTLLPAVENCVAAIQQTPGVITPFPGGVVRSGSKVGSRYSTLRASTNDAFCPTLKTVSQSELPADCHASLEIVIDGLTKEAIADAMRAGMRQAIEEPAISYITAGNYGGKLGPHHFHLHELYSATQTNSD